MRGVAITKDAPHKRCRIAWNFFVVAKKWPSPYKVVPILVTKVYICCNGAKPILKGYRNNFFLLVSIVPLVELSVPYKPKNISLGTAKPLTLKCFATLKLVYLGE